MINKQSDSLGIFHEKCKAGGLKITPQRTAIYQSLRGDKGHPCADMVFVRIRRKIPNISFDTVNRTLLSFADLGILKVVEGYGRPKRFDPDTQSHHHFQCLKCNKIIDFWDRSLDTLEVPKDLKSRFTITGKKIVLEGFCDVCRK
jgi:Fur family transcriptional regulator, peroxide stress response regulator